MSDDQHCTGGGDHGHQHGLSCQELCEFLLSYVEHELDGQVREEFERHVKLCPPCGHYLDGYRETVALIRSCGRQELDPEQKRKHRPPEALIQAILSAKAKAKASR